MATKNARAVLSPTLISLAVASCFAAATALANPVGPKVVNGQVSIHQAGNLLTITNSPNSIINWQSFSIGANEITRFLQQSSSSAVLNRVTGSGGRIDPSVILGTLQSNGRVFLINPSGIVFGAGAQIDVAGLVASSLNLSNADFLAGRLRFTEFPGAGSVANEGNIHAPGGQVYLVGPAVTNSGVITTPHGEVVLAAGNRVELVNPGTPNLRVEIVAADNQARNLGQIVSDAGRVGIYAGIINHSGTIRADSARVTEDGRIVLKATKNTTLEPGSVTTANGPKGGRIEIQSGDTTIVAGTVEAKGSEGKGGTVHVLGERVALVGDASIDASGATGGGTVLVGGSFQGKNPAIKNAASTVIGPDASIAADAIARGNGGKVIVWSDEMTRAYGTISARGGQHSGDGGLVEVSSKGWLDFNANVNTSAPKGKSGTLLLDPSNVEIVATPAGAEGGFSSAGDPTIFTPSGFQPVSKISWSVIKTQVEDNQSNLVITTSGSSDPGHEGNITVSAPGAINTTKYLQLVAHNNINVNGSITNAGTGQIRMFAGWDGSSAANPSTPNPGTINLNAPVSTGGHVILSAGTSIMQAANAPVTADHLAAMAGTGQVKMDLAANLVNRLMGNAGTAFRFNNNKALLIGPTNTGFGSGIFVNSTNSAATIEITANALTVTSEISANGGSGQNATVRLNGGSGGIKIDGGEGVRAIGGSSFIAEPRKALAQEVHQPGGEAAIFFDTNGNIELDNGTEMRARGGSSNTDVGGRARIIMSADGNVTIKGGSRVLVQAGDSTAGNGGQGLIEFTSGGTTTVNGLSRLVADGGEGHTNGGAASVDLFAAANLTVSGAQGAGAFGGNGGARGGDAATLLRSGAGSIFIDEMQQTVNSNKGGRSGRGIFSLGGHGLHEGGRGGNGLTSLITDGAGSIMSNVSHIDSIGGNGAQGGSGTVTLWAKAGGSVSITNGYDDEFFPGTPQILGNTVGALGGSGLTKGGAATATVTATSGNVTIDHDVLGAVGGDAEIGVGGDAALAVGAGGTITVTVSNTGALGGNGATGGGNAGVGFVAGGDITITGPSPLVAGSAAHGAIGGSSGGGKAGDANLAYSSTGGSIIVSADVIGAAGGSVFGETGTGGNGTLSFDAKGGIFSNQSHIVAIGGFGPTAGGAARLNFRGGERIEIIGSTHQGGATPDNGGGKTVMASGGSSQSAAGLGSAEVFMEVTSPTGMVVIQDDFVIATGGQLGEGSEAIFGPAAIRLSFPGRTSGGFSVNGVDGALNGALPPGCTGISPTCLPAGFIVNQGSSPTVLDTNFFVQYGSAPSDERFVNVIVDAMNRILDMGNDLPEEPGDEPGNSKKKGQTCS